jgi:hypothetical protein
MRKTYNLGGLHMRHFGNMTAEEQANVVKTFCELHESGEYTVREIAEKLDISKEHAGMLSTLLHLNKGVEVWMKKQKKKVSHGRRLA